MSTETWAIAWPYENGLGPARLVITDVPAGSKQDDVLAQLDAPAELDRAIPEQKWSKRQKDSAADAPHIRWRGRMGRPEVGPEISVRIPHELLDAVGRSAGQAGETRSQAIRRLLLAGLDNE